VARDRITRKHMCHVFRCDIPARTIANTLRDICKKIMIERSLQQNLAKPIDIIGKLICTAFSVGMKLAYALLVQRPFYSHLKLHAHKPVTLHNHVKIYQHAYVVIYSICELMFIKSIFYNRYAIVFMII